MENTTELNNVVSMNDYKTEPDQQAEISPDVQEAINKAGESIIEESRVLDEVENAEFKNVLKDLALIAVLQQVRNLIVSCEELALRVEKLENCKCNCDCQAEQKDVCA